MDSKYFGKYGFKTKGVSKAINTINIGYINDNPEKFGLEVDLGKLGYDKLLGSGRVTRKLKIKVRSASKKVVEKVKKTGGEVILDEVKSE